MNETDPPASRLSDEAATNDADPVPPSRHRRIVARVLVAAVLLTLTGLAVRRTPLLGCTFPPGDQAAAVTAYRKDPAFSLTPPNGRLLKEASKTRACDHRVPQNREESAGPEFATVWRQYSADRAYTVDELVALVGPDVEAAGWQYQVGDAGDANLRYCKTINGRTARLDVTSLADGTPDHLATFIVYIDGVPDNAGC
ncbi:hypothetical protein [Micromonospora sp. RTP1Z1]|uniref:hypothetical protein n=1 Tax=Micromonospora sp. RTP1Z1 TaxID=2994043 RepID=UPI0029C725FC|nr:hypothetical protein [Micromonospora sp. RTP1Z1]